MKCLVQGFGFNDNKYQSRVGNTTAVEYVVWSSMLSRCTEKYWKEKPTYIGTTCSDNFKSYSFFYEWCQEQIGFNSKDDKGNKWHLDKDLLVKGNKIYSEETCVFVPQRINSLLTKSRRTRKGCPLGVRWHEKDKKFHSRCGDGCGGVKHLGCFQNQEEAFQAYKTFKEALVKEIANEYKEQLDSRVYDALIEYEANIND